MSRDEVFGALSRLLIEMFELPPEAIRLDAHLIDDLDLDSIDAIDMVARLQELTGHRVAEDELRSVRTVADVVEVVHRHFQTTPVGNPVPGV